MDELTPTGKQKEILDRQALALKQNFDALALAIADKSIAVNRGAPDKNAEALAGGTFSYKTVKTDGTLGASQTFAPTIRELSLVAQLQWGIDRAKDDLGGEIKDPKAIAKFQKGAADFIREIEKDRTNGKFDGDVKKIWAEKVNKLAEEYKKAVPEPDKKDMRSVTDDDIKFFKDRLSKATPSQNTIVVADDDRLLPPANLPFLTQGAGKGGRGNGGGSMGA